MEVRHRKAIVQNIKNLMEVPNFTEIREQLIQFGVYDRNMLDHLLANEIQVTGQQAQKLFLDLQTRGPKTFNLLVEALRTTGNNKSAYKLVKDASEKPESSESGIIAAVSSWSPGEDEIDTSSNCSSTFSSSVPPLKRFKSVEQTVPEREEAINKSRSPTPNEELSQRSSSPIQLCVFGNDISKIKVYPAKKFNNGILDASECYVMKSRPRGFALVVNNIEFIGDPGAKRNGAEYDSINLKTLLEQMGYEVTLAENMTKQQLLDPNSGVLKTFMNKFNDSTVDSCLVSLNSHGFNRDLIRMSDPPRREESSTAVDLFSDIIQRFSNRHFSQFQGKPKVFLVNACRGSNSNRAVRRSFELEHRKTQCDGDNGPVGLGSEYSDIFVLRSTVPEYVSMRDLDRGTWFVECVYKAFSQFANRLHFTDLKCKVSEFMEMMYDENSRGKQSCHYEEYGITKRLYFNPGL